MAIGVFLRNLRRQHGWTLREAAEKVDLSHGYLSQVENGKVRQPSPHILQRLSEIYQVSYEVLMAEAGYIQKSPASSPRVHFRGAERLTPEQIQAIQQLIDTIVDEEGAE